jgi:hypothetical protein
MRMRATFMVGRDTWLRTIEDALRSARRGNGGSVFVTGEGGIGKSRLLAAAADAGYAAGMTTLRGRGSAIGPMVPFRSLTEALLSLTRGPDPVDPGALGPYRPVLGRLIPDWGLPSDPAGGGSIVVLAEAVLRLVALAGRGRGCLFVLDDLQDADAETLAVVEYLIDNLDRQPVVLLGAMRSEPCPAADLAAAAAQRGSARLADLPRLERDHLAALVASCLDLPAPAVPAALVDRVWDDSAGNPLLAEELLSGLVDSGALAREACGWRVAGRLQTTVPVTLIRSMARRLDQLDPRWRELLSTAAVLGRRFPVAVVQAATGIPDRELLSYLHSELTDRLVTPDDELPDWYAFQHPLIVEALLTLIPPGERRRLHLRAADAVRTVYPGLPGEWCQVAATLSMHAGDSGAAGRLFAEAGRRALANGAADSAVTLLDRARDLLVDDDAVVRADAFAALLHALTEAGLVERAIASADAFDRVAGVLDRRATAELHTRIAWAATVAGRTADGLAQVAAARALLGPDAPPEDTAPIDIVAAHLALDVSGPDQIGLAESLARRAAEVAEATPLPAVACQALQLLGTLTRSRSPEEATACLERSRELAVRHNLPIWEIHALVRLGNDDAVRDAGVGRLEQARREAARVGAVTAQYQAEASLALQAVLRGDFEAAGGLVDGVLTATTRLKLLETTQYVLLVRTICRAHQGRRREMDAALAEFRRWHGDPAQHAPRVYGLARTWCALMEEDRARAELELSHALAAEDRNPTAFQLSGRFGLHLLLRALAADLDWPEYEAVTRLPASRPRWDRQFAALAEAVRAGRDGRAERAAAAVDLALRLGEPYLTGRHLGLRLVS